MNVAIVTTILTVVGSLIAFLYQQWDDDTTIDRPSKNFQLQFELNSSVHHIIH
ncbi:MAG TPA: hypothetical protein VMU30_12860 [Bacteroidota bacterium]|nr:hypothetical protein [Bacteroidota bacterium]